MSSHLTVSLQQNSFFFSFLFFYGSSISKIQAIFRIEINCIFVCTSLMYQYLKKGSNCLKNPFVTTGHACIVHLSLREQLEFFVRACVSLFGSAVVVERRLGDK